ncbi:MAG: hypothetical protein C0594_02445 [Marinilabiliales bacterium]|nr:MAG: hypothetical protein C0594_02445 [Marinilabiliales bacterium]
MKSNKLNKCTIVGLILISIIALSCNKREDDEKLQTKQAGAWEIQVLDVYVLDTITGGFVLFQTYQDAGFFLLYDNVDEIDSPMRNRCEYKIDSTASSGLTEYLHRIQNDATNYCYWIADSENQITLWYGEAFNYLTIDNVVTISIEKDGKNKQTWTCYLKINQYSDYVPGTDYNVKEVYTVERKKY